MNEQSAVNKKAWEYRCYEFWMSQGSPDELARGIIKDPKARLRYHQKYFENTKGLKVANICGSNGRKAVPLSLLGANVTVFDISQENKKYALELAQAANTDISYEVCDIYDIPLDKFSNQFDIVYVEGGILHYFNDISKFTSIVYHITKHNGKLILSDFHPYRKINPVGNIGKSAKNAQGNYFDDNIYSGDIAYKSFFPEDEQHMFPNCSLRLYTLSEIINSVIKAGFTINEFLEHPHWDDSKIPGEFTIYATK